jgi:hypothetical protein
MRKRKTPPLQGGAPISEGSFSSMPSVSSSSAADKPAERELLISDLRLAAARAKLEVQVIESLTISLRQRVISCAGVREALRKEGIYRLGGAA